MENSMEVSQKIKNRTIMESSNPTSSYLSIRIKIRILKICALQQYSIIHDSQDAETT